MQRLNEDVFSPAAQRVLRRAWALARLRGIESVPLDTLLDGLRQEEGIAREILQKLDLHDPEPAELAHLPALPPKRLLAPEVVRVFDEAEGWVRELGPHLTVGSEHVLFGAVVVSSEFAARCADAGLTLESLRTELIDRSGFTAAPVVAGVELDDSAASIDDDAVSLRIIDASLHRVAEGLRAVEDYFRFGLNDPALSESAKSIRHSLQPIARRFSTERLAAVRDLPGDVGTAISLPSEQSRGTAAEVAAVNLSRVQESVRSAEEYAKTQDGELASSLEQIRYRVYELDKVFARSREARRRLLESRLCVLLAAQGMPFALETTAVATLAGGADIIQLRDKHATDRELVRAARLLRVLTRDAGAILIINDRPDIACLSDADGVHLGQDDLAASDARKIVGPDRLVGVSTHTLDDIAAARRDGADYIGVGPTFPSQTKSFEEFAGLDFVREACTAHSLPAFAIGGVSIHNIEEIRAVGCDRIAVANAVTHAEHPEVATRRLKAALVERPPEAPVEA